MMTMTNKQDTLSPEEIKESKEAITAMQDKLSRVWRKYQAHHDGWIGIALSRIVAKQQGTGVSFATYAKHVVNQVALEWKRQDKRRNQANPKTGKKNAAVEVRKSVAKERHTDLEDLRNATVFECKARYKDITGQAWDADAEWLLEIAVDDSFRIEEQARAALVKLRDALIAVSAADRSRRERDCDVATVRAPGYDPERLPISNSNGVGGPLAHWIASEVSQAIRTPVLDGLVRMPPGQLSKVRIDLASLELRRERLAYVWPGQRVMLTEFYPALRASGTPVDAAEPEVAKESAEKIWAAWAATISPPKASATELAVIWILIDPKENWPDHAIKMKAGGSTPGDVIKSARKGWEKMIAAAETITPP